MIKKYLKRAASVLLCTTLFAGSFATTVLAEDDDSFKGWDEEKQSDTWDVFTTTEWRAFKDDLILDNLKSKAEAIDLSWRVKSLREVVKKVLSEMDSSYGMYKNSSYTELMLAMIQVISNGNPDKNDPCMVRTYINPKIPEEKMTQERSIQEMFKRLSSCEDMTEGDVSIYQKDKKLLSVVQGVITLPEYTKLNKEYSIDNAQKYIDTNKTKLHGEPYADFAEQVSAHYTAVSVDKQYQGTGDAMVGQKIAAKGQEYIGNPYVYGGNSLTNGIDCSGFVQQIHALCGIKGLPRNSREQRKGGKPVNGGLANALPGDVICYDGHVAIYIGNNAIVHASNPSPYPKGGIKITNNAAYKPILAVRRYW